MSSYEEYMRSRGGAELAAVDAEYRKFKGMDQEFDGGDSGGGVVGDGNTDLEDQHNSASIVRGGFGGAASGGGSLEVGRGTVKSATESRTASAGKNYFGRSTGYADQKIAEISEDDIKNHKMDKVRAQQLENWHNQRGIAKENRAMGQGVVFGEDPNANKGMYSARDALSSDAWRQGSGEGQEMSQRDLASHLDNMRTTAAARLDGEAWGEISESGSEEVEATYEINAPMNGLSMTDIKVKNMFNTFAPFQCDFTPDSPREFTVSPNAGSMNRRSGEPIEVTVRFEPKSNGPPMVGTLVFETEDFKHVYKFIGST